MKIPVPDAKICITNISASDLKKYFGYNASIHVARGERSYCASYRGEWRYGAMQNLYRNFHQNDRDPDEYTFISFQEINDEG